jgi:hypothetical protein
MVTFVSRIDEQFPEFGSICQLALFFFCLGLTMGFNHGFNHVIFPVSHIFQNWQTPPRYEDKVQANPLVKDRYCFRVGDWYRVTGEN